MFAQTIPDTNPEGARLGERLKDLFCPAACHEIYAAHDRQAVAATAFALTMAYQSASTRPVIWIRHDFLDREFGMPFPLGIAELGLAPRVFTLVRAPHILAALQAGLEAARCGALGVVVIELWGTSKFLDHTASRRLTIAAQTSGVTLLMTRAGAQPQQSAAVSRWHIESAPSRALAANAPGSPAFKLTMLRHRGGFVPREWHLEWNRDQGCFDENPLDSSIGQGHSNAASLSGAMVPFSFGRQVGMAVA